MNEGEPKFIVEFGDGEYEATPDNTSLFTHIGRLACYNHVFFQTDTTEDGTMRGTYLFCQNPAFESVAEFMMANDYPCHLNLHYAAESDISAFNKMVERSIPDFDTIPEEWLRPEDE